jgi:hypothetical protein
VRAFAGNGLRPLSPCHVSGTLAANGDRTFAWIRRTRINGDSWDIPDVPLGEESESYQVRVLQGQTVLREVLVNSPTWTYPSAAQVEDGLGSGAVLSVAQVSATFGAGLDRRVDIGA